jgi:hypothetical protein
MELRLFAEIFYFLTKNMRPKRFDGLMHKDDYKSWKRNIQQTYSVEKKDVKQELIFMNCLLMRKGKGGVKRIVVKKSELETIWQKFHVHKESGGHQGNLWN